MTAVLEAPVVTRLPGHARTRQEHVWSTVVSLHVRDVHATDAGVDAAWASVRAELHRIDRVYSTFRDDSVVSRLRRGGTHVVAPDVAQVIERCLEARRLTDGAFDPWSASGGFDPSGLVKGWAADRCAALVRQHGFREFSIDAGGDVACRGALDGRGWPMGIAHPDDPMSVVAVADVLDASIATSGISERGEHIVDPLSGDARPAGGARQATVVGNDGALADAIATGLMVAGADGARWFSALPGWSGHVVVGDRAIAWGPAFDGTAPPREGAKEQ